MSNYKYADSGRPKLHDSEFRGPLKQRSCTDIICLSIFLLFIATWIGVGIFVIQNGDPEMLLIPRDYKGRRCGVDYEVLAKPYLLHFDLARCLSPWAPIFGCQTPQICVEKCPQEAFLDKHSMPVKYCTDEGTCPDYIIPSDSVENRCFPDPSSIQYYFEDIKKKTSVDTEELFWKAVKNAKFLMEVQEFGQKVFEDIINSWWKILSGIGMAIISSIIFIFMLRWFASLMVYFSLLGVIGLLSFGIYFSAKKYTEIQNKIKVNSSGEELIRKEKDMWMSILIGTSIVLLLVLLIVIFLRKRIRLAIALIGEGSKAVSSMTSVLLFPIFPWILQIGIISYAVIVALYLSSTGKPIYQYVKHVDQPCRFVGTPCSPSKFPEMYCLCEVVGIDNVVYYPYLQILNLFGLFWLVFFASAFGEMILAGVFAQWYWNKAKLPFSAILASIGRTLRYHLGTLAYGSLIIAICRMIRVVLEYADRNLKKYNNSVTRAILCCCKCCFWCLETFLRFINKNAYIVCAIHGKNFCESAREAFQLLIRNVIRVVVLDKVTDFLFFTSKMLITIGVGSVSYVVFATDLTSVDNSKLNYTFVPVTVIMLITYLITSIFFGVYSMAVDTIFLCFLEDYERNDGSEQRPYAMSKHLMQILGKKNKEKKK